MGDESGYFDLEVHIEEASKSWSPDEVFFVKDLKQRKLFINESICESNPDCFGVVHNIMQYNADDKGIPVEERKPILLYVSSPGGSVDLGFQIINAILNSKTPVYTINFGYQYSMGFLIGLAGHKRFAMEHSKFLMHDGSMFIVDSTSKAKDQMEFQLKQEERIKNFVVGRSNVTPEEYEAKFSKEWYMFADEAKERGFVDYIIGVDCDLDEVI